MKLDEDEEGGLGFGGADEPEGFFAAGVEKTGGCAEPSLRNPGFDLGNGGSAGGKDDPSPLASDPAGFDSGKGVLSRIRLNAEIQPASRQFGAIAANGGFQPTAGGWVIVLFQNLTGSGQGGFSRGEVGAEKEEITPFHDARDAAKERERLEVG